MKAARLGAVLLLAVPTLAVATFVGGCLVALLRMRRVKPIPSSPAARCPACGTCPGAMICVCSDPRCPCWKGEGAGL